MKVNKMLAKVLCVAYAASLAVMPAASAASTETVIANVDFESYATTATAIDFTNDANNVHPDYEQDSLSYISDVSYQKTNGESMFVLSEAGNKFLRVFNKKNFSSKCYDSGTYDTEVRVPVTLDGTDTLEVSMKIRAMDDSYTSSMNMENFNFWGASNGAGTITENNNGLNIKVTDSNPVQSVVTLSSSEWTTLKAIYRPEGGVYKVDYYANGELKATRTTTTAQINDVRIIKVNNSSDVNAYYDIDDIKVRYNPEKEFTCNSMSLSSSTNVDIDIGRITLTFSENVKPSTASNITLKDSDGVSAPNFAATADGKNVILTFGGLSENTTYTINVPATVLSDGSEGKAVIPNKFTFKTLSNSIADVDYEDYTTTATSIDFANDANNVHPDYEQDNLGYISDVSYKKTNGESMFVLSENGNKFLRVFNRKNFSSKCYDSGTYDTEVRVPVSLDGTNSLVAELKIRAMDGSYTSANMENFTFWGAANAAGTITNTDGTSIRVTDSNPVMSIGTLSSSEWMTLKAIYTPDNGKYRVDYYANGTLKGSRTTNAASVNEIRLIKVNVSGDADAWYDVDDIKISYLRTPKVISSDTVSGIVPVSRKTLDLYFNVDMNSDTITDQTVSVMLDGNKIDTTVAYFPATNHMTIGFVDYLTPGKDYVVVFNNVKSADGVYMNSTFTFRSGNTGLTPVSTVLSETEDGAAINAIPASGNVYAKAVVKNETGTSGKAMIIIAAYDNTGRLIQNPQYDEETIAATGEEVTIKTSITGVADADEVRVYLWNGFGNMSPILTTPVKIN